MVRILKVLIAAALASLAVMSLGLSVAQAETPIGNTKLTAAEYPAFLHGGSAKGKEIFTTEAGTVKCKSTFTATITGPTQTLRVAPTYSECEAFGFLSATVSMEGCEYEFHLTTKVTVPETEDPIYQSHVDLVCPAGKAVKIVASTCEAQIHPQNAMTTVDIHNMTLATPKDLTVWPTVTVPKYTVTKDGIGCPFGGTGEKSNATYTSTEGTTVQCFKDEKGVKGALIACDIGESP